MHKEIKMKPRFRNPYGYKVCYREKYSPVTVRHFLTYTYKQAVAMKRLYLKHPQIARKDGHLLTKPTWFIIPIKKSEVRAGIWREVPF